MGTWDEEQVASKFSHYVLYQLLSSAVYGKLLTLRFLGTYLLLWPYISFQSLSYLQHGELSQSRRTLSLQKWPRSASKPHQDPTECQIILASVPRCIRNSYLRLPSLFLITTANCSIAFINVLVDHSLEYRHLSPPINITRSVICWLLRVSLWHLCFLCFTLVAFSTIALPLHSLFCVLHVAIPASPAGHYNPLISSPLSFRPISLSLTLLSFLANY